MKTPRYHILMFAVICLAATIAITSKSAKAEDDNACVHSGVWYNPADKQVINYKQLINRTAKRGVILLGESHTSGEHHRWQLHTLAALHALNPNMVLGFEAFPRSSQPVLDKWIRGELNKKQFLDQSRWFDVWKFDPKLYMPLFDFARMHRIPMRALNVDRPFIRRISRDGWEAIPEEERNGLSTPAIASAAYLDYLKKAFGQHDNTSEPIDENDPQFRSFIQVQLTWDRAMAEGLSEARKAGGDPIVVGIVGRGHTDYGYGIPHQLKDLGIPDPVILSPWDVSDSCDRLVDAEGTPLADAVFGINQPENDHPSFKPLLGVRIETAKDGGVNVVDVVDGSVAKKAGIEKHDLIFTAAEQPVVKTQDLIGIIKRQAPGTWLPIQIRRNGTVIHIIAKFPVTTKSPHHP